MCFNFFNLLPLSLSNRVTQSLLMRLVLEQKVRPLTYESFGPSPNQRALYLNWLSDLELAFTASGTAEYVFSTGCLKTVHRKRHIKMKKNRALLALKFPAMQEIFN